MNLMEEWDEEALYRISTWCLHCPNLTIGHISEIDSILLNARPMHVDK
jgi:hypothetical protein